MQSKTKPTHSQLERNTPPIVPLPVHRANRSNINIQINFNVKEKGSGGVFAGKKIDNLVEVVAPKLEEDKKARRKMSRDDGRDIERKKTKEKYEGTPEKGSNQKKQQRSKSTNAKRLKKSLINENIKATQITNHLNVKMKPHQNKSSSASPQKSRSMSQSSKKLLSRPKTSNKNLLGYGFTNAVIVKQRPLTATVKSTKSKQKLIVNQTHAHTYKSKEEQIKIKQFMSDKKKKEKKQKQKTIKEQKLKRQKIQQQLRRVEMQRKANASKPSIAFSPKKSQPQPIYFGQDDGSFHEHQNYDKLTHQAQNLIRVTDTIPSHNPSQEIQSKGQRSTSGIKSKSRKSGKSLIRGFMEGTLNKNEFKKLKRSVIKIQSLFRGCLARKKFINQLTNEQGKIRSIKHKIQNNSKLYWGSQTDNSVINLQSYVSPRQSNQPQERMYQSPINKRQLQECARNFYKIQNSHLQERFSEQSSSKESPNKYNIEMDESIQEQQESKPKPLIKPIKFLKPKHQEQINVYPTQQTQINVLILKQIEDLKKKLNMQDQKFKILQEQNQNLKANIKMLSLRQSREIEENQPIQNDSVQFFQIRMPQKIQSPLNQMESDMKKKRIQITLDEVKEPIVQANQAGIDISSLKKQLESFQCSPSHAKMQQVITQKLRKKNVESLFQKKELKIEQSYAKKAEIFDKMLHDHLFSPRTYNFKKNELSQKLLLEKSLIQQRLEQAKRVVGFIEDISSSDESQSNYQSPLQTKDKKYFQKQQKSNRSIQKKTKNDEKDGEQIQNQQIIQIASDRNTFKKKLPFVKQEQEQIKGEEQQQSNLNKYWTDDIDTIHQKTLEIHRRIDQALLAQSESSSQYHSLSSQYRSTENPIQQYPTHQIHEEQPNKEQESKEQSKKQQQNNQQQHKNDEPIKNESQDKLEKQVKLFAAIFNNVDIEAFQQNQSDEYQNQAFDEYEPQHQLTTSNLVSILNNVPAQQQMHPGQAKNVSSPIVIDNLSQDSDSKNNSQVYEIVPGQLNNNSNVSSQSAQSQNLFISQQNKSSQSSKPFFKGFQTSLTFIKQFCIAICEYIRNSSHLKEYFQQNISLPLRYDRLQLIKAYRTTLSNEHQTTFNSYLKDYIYPFFRCIAPKVHAISSELFTDFMECYDKNNQYNPKWNDPELSEEGKEMRQFYLISIIDAFNEALDYERPCGIVGESFAWLQNWKCLKNHKTSKWNYSNTDHHADHADSHANNRAIAQNKRKPNNNSSQEYSGESDADNLPQQQQRLDQIFGTSIAKLIQWGSSLCGFIPEPITLEMDSSQVININEEQTAQIRQTRMALMLEKGLLEDEESMLECGQQLTEVILSLSEKVIEELFHQALQQIIIK